MVTLNILQSVLGLFAGQSLIFCSIQSVGIYLVCLPYYPVTNFPQYSECWFTVSVSALPSLGLVTSCGLFLSQMDLYTGMQSVYISLSHCGLILA